MKEITNFDEFFNLLKEIFTEFTVEKLETGRFINDHVINIQNPVMNREEIYILFHKPIKNKTKIDIMFGVLPQITDDYFVKLEKFNDSNFTWTLKKIIGQFPGKISEELDKEKWIAKLIINWGLDNFIQKVELDLD